MIPIHILCCYILIVKFDLGVAGAGMATSFCFVFAFTLYTLTAYLDKALRPAFFLPSVDSIKHAWSYFKVAFPPALLMMFDFVILELVTIISA
jgi:Na+-driven multidrug efflux pump